MPDAFVLDASVLVAAALPNEPFHADAKALLKHLWLSSLLRDTRFLGNRMCSPYDATTNSACPDSAVLTVFRHVDRATEIAGRPAFPLKAGEPHLFAEGAYLYLPTIAFAEVAAAIARGVGDEQLALAVVAQYTTRPDLHRIAVDTALGNHATRIAAQQRIRGCDAVYVALADFEQAVLVTLDGQQRDRAPASITARTPAQALAEWLEL